MQDFASVSKWFVMSNDYWETPQQVFDTLNNIYNFEVDICCVPETAKCARYFTEQDDSLSFRWHQLSNIKGKYIWCNPPYSDPKPWVQHAIDAQLNDVGVVMLLNNDTSVGWYAEAIQYVSKVTIIIASPKDLTEYSSGRLAFANKGVTKSQNSKGQVLFEFDPKRVGECEVLHITKNKIMGVK